MQASELFSIKDSPELVLPSYEELEEEIEVRILALECAIVEHRLDRVADDWQEAVNRLSVVQLDEYNHLDRVLG